MVGCNHLPLKISDGRIVCRLCGNELPGPEPFRVFWYRLGVFEC